MVFSHRPITAFAFHESPACEAFIAVVSAKFPDPRIDQRPHERTGPCRRSVAGLRRPGSGRFGTTMMENYSD